VAPKLHPQQSMFEAMAWHVESDATSAKPHTVPR